MNAKLLILTLSFTLGAGAAVAAIKYGHIEVARAAPAAQSQVAAIPRIVVTATRDRVLEAPVPRVVVVARRADASQVVAAGR